MAFLGLPIKLNVSFERYNIVFCIKTISKKGVSPMCHIRPAIQMSVRWQVERAKLVVC